ncbi:MAG: polyprenyl synthetase family protein [Syntrophobacterales bacterium]|jgi:octaprenyl-diphosphate synthase|nr:polyprenyl synthetase family protein [Syntrophobacterales bacterium]
MESVARLIESDLKTLEQSIQKLVTTRVSFIKQIVTYIISSGGKRIRPILLILSSRLSGYEGNRHIPYAAIVEFIHTATLLHDDVVDNAKTRRGNSTVNTVWGNESSVLVGDFLYSKSFELMAEDGNHDILKTISKATTALSEGEILELLKTSDVETTEEEYFEVVGNKTAVLFSAACEIGALLAGTGELQRTALRGFGYNLGIAFQLKDDILDYTSYDAILGKNVGTDLKEGKVTLPLIHALKSARDQDKAYARKVLEKPTMTQRDFDVVRRIIEKHSGIGYTSDMIIKHITTARDHLKIFEDSPYKKALLTVANHMLVRET